MVDRVGFRQQCTVMNVVVCVKQIPDPAAPPALDPGSKNLVRDGKLILDDSDAYGVEMALQLVDAAGEGEVTLISMAPSGEVSGLRTALAMGAAKAILISDPALAAPMASAVRRPDTSPLGAIETRVTSPSPAASTNCRAISTP